MDDQSRRSATPGPSSADQQHAQAERLALIDPVGRPRRRTHRKRQVAGVLVLLVLVVLALAPTIAGRVGRGWVERSASRTLGVGVRVEKLRLSWFGPQRAEGVQLVDASLRQIADVDLSMDRSLLALARSRTDLGTIHAAGAITIEQRASQTELDRLDADSPMPIESASAPVGSSSSAIMLPRGLAAELQLDGLDVLYRYRDQSEYSITGLTGSLSFGVGRTAEADLAARVSNGQTTASAEIKGSVSGLTRPTGELTPDQAMLTGSIELSGRHIPISGTIGRALESGDAVDDSFTAMLDLSGTMAHGTARLKLGSAGAHAQFPLTYNQNTDSYMISADKGCTADLSAEAVAVLVPQLARLAGDSIEIGTGQQFTFDAVPSLNLSLSTANIEVPTTGGPFDLRRSVIVGSAELRAMSGTLDGTAWAIEPTTVSLSAFGSEGSVRVQGVTTAQLGTQPAGEFVLNATADSLLNAHGGLVALDDSAGLPALLAGLRGGFECNDVQSSLLDPFLSTILDRAGISLPDDIGERFDVEVAFDDSQNRAAHLWLTADNLSARAGILLDGSTLRTDSAGIRVSMDSTSAILTRLLASDAITVNSGGAVELNIKQASVDLNKVGVDRAEPDLSAYAGLVDLNISPMAGVVSLEGRDRAFETSPTTVTLDGRDLASGAGIAAAAGVMIDGSEAGTLSVSLRADQIIDARGVRLPGWPRIEGELALHDALVELAQPLADRSGLVLKQDVGEHLSTIIQAAADPGGTVQITGNIKSENLNADAAFVIRDRVLHTSDTGLTITLDQIGRPLARLLPEPYQVAPGAQATISIPEAAIAIKNRGLDLSKSSVVASAQIDGLTASAGRGQEYKIQRFDADMKYAYGGVPEFGFNGSLTSEGEPVLLAGHFTIPHLVNDGRLTPETAVLDGQMDLTGWPVAPEQSPIGLVADADAGDMRALAAELFGRVLNMTIKADATTGELVAVVQGDRLLGSSRFHFQGGTLDVIGGKYHAKVDPDVIDQIRLRRGQSEGVARPLGARFTAPAEVEFAFGACGLADHWSPKLSGTPNVKLSLSGTITNIELLRAGKPVRSGQIGLDQLVIEGKLPVGAIASDDSGTMLFAISGTATSERGPIGEISGDLAAGFEAHKISGPMDMNLKISSVECGQIDDIAKFDGRLASIAGTSLDLSVEAHGVAKAGRIGSMNASINLTGPRLRTETPIRVSLADDRAELLEPATLRWDIAPELATQIGLGQPVGTERVRVTEMIQTTLRVESLAISRGNAEGSGAFQPGLFNVEASLTAPSASVSIKGENDQTPDRLSTYGPVNAKLSGNSEQLNITGSLPAKDGDSAGLELDLAVSEFAGPDGVLRPDSAILDGRLVSSDMPTPLIDAILAQQGLMAEVLGPMVSATIDADHVRSASGQLDFQFEATRASGSLSGQFVEGRFVATEPGEVVVAEVRPELGQYIGRAIPVIGEVTKSKEDGPARVEINRFEIPILVQPGQTRKQGIIADLNINIGTARFRASSLFSVVLRAVKQRTDSQIGQRIEPIHTRIASGVLTYDRSQIPLGEFTLESEGSYRLADGMIDVVTYIPIAALTDQAAGELNTGLGSLLGRAIPGFEEATMVPWRTRGTPGHLESGPDLELFAKSITDQLDPTDLINKGLGSLQDLLLDKDK